jgi:hypothetical protein
MRPRLVVVTHPGIEIGLQLLEVPVDLLAECHAVESVCTRWLIDNGRFYLLDVDPGRYDYPQMDSGR